VEHDGSVQIRKQSASSAAVDFNDLCVRRYVTTSSTARLETQVASHAQKLIHLSLSWPAASVGISSPEACPNGANLRELSWAVN